MKPNKGNLIVLLVAVLVIISALACDLNPPAPPATQAELFNPLPPPAMEKYPLTYGLVSTGGAQMQRLVTPLVMVEYFQNNSDVPGTIAHQVFENRMQDTVGTMQETIWGDWLNGSVKRVTTYGDTGCLTEGRIYLQIKSVSAWQWVFKGFNLDTVINRSRVVLLYTPREQCSAPVLDQVLYMEEWGTHSNDVVAMGAMAVWDNPGEAFSAYREWGFWEVRQSPFDMAKEAIKTAERTLQTQPADFMAVDKDSLKEVIGRQSGLTLYLQGQEWGKIDFTYANNWGPMPNTPRFGTGALSEVHWVVGDQEYWLVVLSSALSPQATSLYVFADSAQAVADIKAMSSEHQWPTIYDKIKTGTMPGVPFAIYSTGSVADETRTVTTTSQSGVTSSQTIKLSTNGGMYYSIIGDPTFEQVDTLNRLCSLMGLGGIKASGFYYPTDLNTGNGLAYYLAVTTLTLAPESMLKYPYDIGLIDRPGFPLWQGFIQE